MEKANVAPKKRRGKIILITALILCVCLLVGLFIYFKFFSHSKSMGPGLSRMGPVAGLGLAPQQPATLLAETVNCTKQSDGYVEYYAVEAEYKVQIDQGTTFLLPYPDYFRLMEEDKTNEKILKRNLYKFNFSVNGAARQMAFEYLPFAWREPYTLEKPEIYNQSIYIFPNMGEKNQPWNTYTQLINGYKERKTPFNIAADMPVRVYDVTQSPVYGAEERNIRKRPASLEITGRRNQLRMFFGQSEYSYVSGGYGKTINELEHITRDPYFWQADSLTASRYFVTTADTTPLQVCIGEEEVLYTETTFKDFLQTNLAIGEEELNEYMQTFCCSMAEKRADEYVSFASPSAFMEHREYHVYDKVKMGSYTIAEPGEYTIKLEFNIQGEMNNEDYYMLQWIDSPSSMWKSVGERKLTVHMPEKSQSVSIPEYVLNFSSVKEKSVSSPSQ